MEGRSGFLFRAVGSVRTRTILKVEQPTHSGRCGLRKPNRFRPSQPKPDKAGERGNAQTVASSRAGLIVHTKLARAGYEACRVVGLSSLKHDFGSLVHVDV